MTDSTTTIETLKTIVKAFVTERNWQQFHSPKNLSMDLVSESAELMDLFIFCTTEESAAILEKKRSHAEEEVADIAFALLAFCSHYNIDLAKAMERKQQINAQKYPVEKCYGKSVKYTEL